MIRDKGATYLNNAINYGLTTNEAPTIQNYGEDTEELRNNTSPSLIETLDLSNNNISIELMNTLHHKIISTGQIVKTPKYAEVRETQGDDKLNKAVTTEGGKKRKKSKKNK